MGERFRLTEEQTRILRAAKARADAEEQMTDEERAALEAAAALDAGDDATDAADGAPEPEDVDEEELVPGHSGGRRMRAKKSIFKDVVLPDSRAFDVKDVEPSGPRVADEGDDALGREYADGVMDRIAGPFKGGGADAGVIGEFEGDTRGIDYDEAPNFSRDRGGRLIKPNLGAGTGSYIDREDVPVEGGASRPVKLPGGMVLMSPEASGIAPPASAMFPDSKTSALKRVRKSRRVGIFRSTVFGGDKNDTADGYLSEG